MAISFFKPLACEGGDVSSASQGGSGGGGFPDYSKPKYYANVYGDSNPYITYTDVDNAYKIIRTQRFLSHGGYEYVDGHYGVNPRYCSFIPKYDCWAKVYTITQEHIDGYPKAGLEYYAYWMPLLKGQKYSMVSNGSSYGTPITMGQSSGASDKYVQVYEIYLSK